MIDSVYENFIKGKPILVNLETEDPRFIREFHSMCLTEHHGYGILTNLNEIKKVQDSMSGAFRHHVLPLLKKIDELQNGLCRCDRYYTFDERGC